MKIEILTTGMHTEVGKKGVELYGARIEVAPEARREGKIESLRKISE